MKLILKFLILAGAIGLVVLTEKNNWLKTNFVDEQDNFVVAKNLIEGNKLYTNYFSHHQPGAYLLSGLIQKITKPNTIQSLVKQHRQVITLWSIGWIVYIVYRFGFQMIWPMTTLELIKNIYLGNMFLAESLIMAPMVYLVLIFLQNKKIKTTEIFFIGMITMVVAMTLAPTWPVLAIITLGWWIRWKKEIEKIAVMAIGGILVFGVMMNFVDLRGYIENAVMINQKYYIQIAGGGNPVWSLLKATTTPVLYLFNGVNRPEMAMVKIMILVLIVETINLVRQKKFKQVLWVWGILTLTNLRNFELEKTYYDGFHLLIWVGLIVTIPYLIQNTKWRICGLIPIIVLLFINKNEFFKVPNYENEFEVYYSRIFNMSEAIRTIKNENSRLLAMPDEVLGYWQAGIKPAGRFIFFYKWMTEVPELKKEQLLIFASNPEYLIMKDDQGLGIGNEVKSKYQQFSYRGGESEFFVNKEAWKTYSTEKINKLRYYGLEAI